MDNYIIKQLSVFLENQKGELTEVTSILSDENISIKSLLLVDSTDFGILRLIPDDSDKAKNVLTSAGYTVKENQVFAVKAEDKIGSFSRVVKILSGHDINILYTYAFREENIGVFIFKVEKGDFDNAVKALQSEKVEMIDQSFIY
ncbi:MAG: amino acid-binding protein [Proteobacteria bacterium]|nr:amino acid-binding protein [Pseudomonadota bacterium]